jgi:polyphosphate kinase 2 (PPK2 family)
VNLAKDFDPAFEAGIKKKQDGVALLNEGIELLATYQARLAAQDTYGVLVVLQALDAAGKDGTIRHVMTGVNPQGVRVESFKVPSALDRSSAVRRHMSLAALELSQVNGLCWAAEGVGGSERVVTRLATDALCWQGIND